MDSDNSDGDVEHHGMVNHPTKRAVDDTSDVSDDENISHAARSIESPPESPQEAGHFESPPASPASDHKLEETPSSPRSPDEARSPSPDDRQSLDESMSSKDMRSPPSPRSPDDITSPRSVHSPRSIHSPRHVFAPRTPQSLGPHSPEESRSPGGPRSPDEDRPGSPESGDGPRSPDDCPRTPVGCPRSPDMPRSPDVCPRSPDMPRSPDDEMMSSGIGSRRMPRSPPSPQSPRSVHSPRPPRSPLEYILPARSRSISPPLSPQSLPPEDREITSPAASDKDGHLSDSNSDDGRSNISSNSSFGLPSRRTSTEMSVENKTDSPKHQRKAALELQNHAEDLSDVSELGSLECVSDDEPDKKSIIKMENGEQSQSPTRIKEENDGRDVISKDHSRVVPSGGGLEGDDGEALDFEPGEEREEGECEGLAGAAKVSDDEGELKGEELEEGELTDEGENRPEETEPRPICRFYNRGQCTWGSQCRFVHPGVTDKGNYTMFEMVRPLVPVNGPQSGYSVDYRLAERPAAASTTTAAAATTGYSHTRKEETPVVESAWERGLRQAKEMLRKSTKRKETEVDFEEKKMNLTLSQDELDKENDLYLTRSASPILSEEPERWSAKADEGKRYRTVSERFEDYGGGPDYVYHSGRDWYHRGGAHYDVPSHHMVRESEYHQSSRSKYHSAYSAHHRSSAAQQDYYDRKKNKQYPPREVIVQRADKSSWKDDSPPPSRSSRRETGRERDSGVRADDWADPWMRSKSPVGRKGRTRKQSYSSGSSYSSSSSSPSSRSSSYSSGSRDSRSRTHSSRSRSRSRKPVSPSRRLPRTSPLNRSGAAGRVASPAVLSDKWANPERALMNPPPPSPRKGRGPASPANLRRNPTPPERRGGVPARLLAHSKAAVAAAMRSARSRSKSSHSSSGSDSSGSSSDSSESSVSSSSSSRGPSPSPPVRSKRIVIDERLALAQAAMKVKAMDALKLSGQKQQIKLTLKGSVNAERPQPSVVVGKKRPLPESPTLPDDDSPPKGLANKSTPKKTAPSRREELLKQLKAVEDAIARKRSKIM